MLPEREGDGHGRNPSHAGQIALRDLFVH
jgi:hypothetical protein